MAWLDANDSHPYPTDQQLEEWADEYGVTEHQLRTWFNKVRSTRKANKAKLNENEGFDLATKRYQEEQIANSLLW